MVTIRIWLKCMSKILVGYDKNMVYRMFKKQDGYDKNMVNRMSKIQVG